MLWARPAEGQAGSGGDLLFARDNLVAWCIVAYDALERAPAERARMLNELGIRRLAWDWRDRHLPILAEEIQTLREHDIELTSVWFWVDNRASSGLLPHHDQILEALEEAGAETTLWVSFDSDFFAGMSDEARVDKGAAIISHIRDRAKRSGSTIALYNHGDWFGEPENQIRIIEAIGADDIGLVYNFHHAHEQVEAFPQLVATMLPYLEAVNLNGMQAGGPKILNLGAGDLEADMLRVLRASGFSGAIGILGHTEGEDARDALDRNLEGLQRLLAELGEAEALATYRTPVN